MMIPKELEKYKEPPKDCPKYDKKNPDYRCSVDYDKSNYRKNKAAEEAEKENVSIAEICELINLFLSKIYKDGIKCNLINGPDILKTIDYEHIRRSYNLNDQSDIVWMKFTTDGYLGVVASSKDINFNYNNSSGKLIKSVNKRWDESKVVIVPLPKIESPQERLLIERMIGNYLSDNDVPIIDFCSHNL